MSSSSPRPGTAKTTPPREKSVQINFNLKGKTVSVGGKNCCVDKKAGGQK